MPLGGLAKTHDMNWANGQRGRQFVYFSRAGSLRSVCFPYAIGAAVSENYT